MSQFDKMKKFENKLFFVVLMEFMKNSAEKKCVLILYGIGLVQVAVTERWL